MPQLDSSHFISQIFWLLIVFAGLYCIIAVGLFPKIKKIVRSRKSQIKTDLMIASKANEEAKIISAECEQLLLEAKAKARLLLVDAEHNISLMIANRLHELDHELFFGTKEAAANINSIKGNVLEEMQTLENQIVDLVLQKFSSAKNQS